MAMWLLRELSPAPKSQVKNPTGVFVDPATRKSWSPTWATTWPRCTPLTLTATWHLCASFAARR